MNEDLELLIGLDPNTEGLGITDDPTLLTNLEDTPSTKEPQTPTQVDTPPVSEPEPTSQDKTKSDFDLIGAALLARGFKDPNNIKIETDLGIETKSFDELTNEEKLQILNTSPNDNFELAPEETQLISFMRENELTQQDLISYFKALGVQEYLDNNVQLEVDSLSDEELLAMDLANTYEDWTEEEINDEVERSKANPNLFAKKVAKLRDIYKEIEQQRIEEEKQKEVDPNVDPEAAKQFLEAFKEAGTKYNNISGVDLEESDLISTYDYAFKPTINGLTKLDMDLKSPERLFKVAFLMAHGDEVLQNLHTVYRQALAEKDKEIKALKSNPSNPKGNNNNSKSTVSTTQRTTGVSYTDDLDSLLKLKN